MKKNRCKPLEEVAKNLEASKAKHPSHLEPGFNEDGSLAEISLVETKSDACSKE